MYAWHACYDLRFVNYNFFHYGSIEYKIEAVAQNLHSSHVEENEKERES